MHHSGRIPWYVSPNCEWTAPYLPAQSAALVVTDNWQITLRVILQCCLKIQNKGALPTVVKVCHACTVRCKYLLFQKSALHMVHEGTQLNCSIAFTSWTLWISPHHLIPLTAGVVGETWGTLCVPVFSNLIFCFPDQGGGVHSCPLFDVI